MMIKYREHYKTPFTRDRIRMVTISSEKSQDEHDSSICDNITELN